MKKTLRFNSIVKEVEQINPLFSKVKIYVMYDGVNRNGSYMSKEAINNALYSIYNIPIVGEYYEDKDNFGGHGGKLELSDEGIKYIVTTKPYGVVPESAEVYWEQVTEEDGQVHDYLVVDGAYLWTGRYSELETILEEKQYGQSMEIEVVEGDYAVREGHDVFDIKEFIFSAFCILGISKDSDPEGYVEPAFEGAKVVAYSLDKDSFKQQFSQMMKELKYTLEVEEGGKNQMEENKVTNQEETDETQFENQVSEPQEQQVPEGSKGVTECATDGAESGTSNFALTHKQIENQLREVLKTETYIDSWGDTCRKYWYVDHTDSQVITENAQEGYQLYAFDYVINSDNVSIQFETGQKVKIEYTPFEGEGINFSSQFERITQEKEALEAEFNTLREYKRNREEDDIRQKFSTKLSEEELNEVFTQHKDSPIEKIEEAIFALIGKKNFSYEKKEKTVEQNKVSVVSPVEKEENPYGDIL